jgi:hypothetical protein
VDRHRAARVDDAVDLPDVGQRRQAADLVEGLERVGDRDREQAAGLERRARAAQEARTPVRSAEELGGLHRHQDQPEAPLAEVEVAGVGHDRLDRQPGRPRAQRGEQVGRAVERDDAVALAGEMERHAAGAGADVEDRSRVADREVAPQREVLGVRAALDVVPDDLRDVRFLGPCGAHAKLLPAAPRATSTSRSASIAV